MFIKNIVKILGTPELIVLGILMVLLVIFGRSLRGVRTRGLALLGIFCALAGATGAAMRSIPGIQMTGFLTIMVGVVLGPGAGLAAGVVSALLFDILSVISIYTPWRMLLWGLMGLFTAFLQPQKECKRMAQLPVIKSELTTCDIGCVENKIEPRTRVWILSIYGFVWGFIFGWISNAVYMFAGILPLTLNVFIISCVTSFWFDLAHAVCNALLLLLFSQIVIKIAVKSGVTRPINKRKKNKKQIKQQSGF